MHQWGDMGQGLRRNNTSFLSELLNDGIDIMSIPCNDAINEKAKAAHPFHLTFIIPASKFSFFPEE
jgi:hypothetical protein